MLHKPWREEVFRYMSGIITAKGCKSIIVNGVEDHVHCFVGFKPVCSVSDLVRDMKNNSSKFINERGYVSGRFQWQEGYGVFSYASSQVKNVYHYILNQEEHHRKKKFKEEYVEFLREFEIEYREEFLFDWLDEDK